MYLSSLLVLLALSAHADAFGPDYLFQNSNKVADSISLPTTFESAVLARRILHLTTLGTLSTSFPLADHHERWPSSVRGMPIGLMDYIADCEATGNPTILAIDIATSFKNVRAGSNITLSIDWKPPYPPKSRIQESTSWFSRGSRRSKDEPIQIPYSAANLPRFSLIGTLEKMSHTDVEEHSVVKCFADIHPDARYWLPGNPIHVSEWMRLVVQEIYWIGGFGDRAYIGWIPVTEWRNVTEEDWKSVKLPGERAGWSEWSMEW